MRISSILVALMFVGSGCGGGGDPEPPKLPQLVDMGGPKLAHPALVPVFFDEGFDHSYTDAMVTHARWLVQSSWLREVGADYGVDTGTVPAIVSLPRPDPLPQTIDDLEIVDRLFGGIADGSIPPPTPDTLYMFYVTGQTVTAGSSMSCVDFGGYHDSARRDGVEIAYAVIATCSSVRPTTVASHELIEAATDPFPSTHPGWRLREPVSPWLIMGDEVADLCQRGGDESETTQDGDYIAQRSWSNAAAAAEDDPCVPHRYLAYYNMTTDAKTLLRIRPGEHQTIQVTGWASIPVAPWKLTAQLDEPSSATFTLGAKELGPGQSTSLDIAVPAGGQVGSFIIAYLLADKSDSYQFLPLPVVVGDPCSSFTDCVSCTVRAGCGFCASSGRCESIGSSGSAESSCSGKSFATWPASCSPGFCASHSGSCGDCSSQFGCGWCAGATPACMEASHDYWHPEDGSCDYANWSFIPNYCPREAAP